MKRLKFATLALILTLGLFMQSFTKVEEKSSFNTKYLSLTEYCSTSSHSGFLLSTYTSTIVLYNQETDTFTVIVTTSNVFSASSQEITVLGSGLAGQVQAESYCN